MTDQTRRPTEGDRVTIHAPDEPANGLTGTINTDDHSALPYFVEFEDRDPEWFYPHQVTLAPARDAGQPLGWVPIRRGRLMEKGDEVYVPPGTSSVHHEIGGNLGVLRLHLDIDEDGDLPIKVPQDGGNELDLRWFRATDCYAPPEFAPGGVIPTPAARPRVGDRVRVQGHNRATNGRTGEIVEDDGSGLPFKVRLAADRGTAVEHIWCEPHQVVLDNTYPEEGERPNPEPPIRVQRRFVVTLERPVSPSAIGRAVGALPPEMEVTVMTYESRIEITGYDRPDADV